MVYFARCPACGAVNDGTSHTCYLCNASPLLVACPGCGAEVRNPVLTCCPSCGRPYRRQNSTLPATGNPEEGTRRKEEQSGPAP